MTSGTDFEDQEAGNWKQHPWKSLPTWGKWVVGIIGALILVSIGAAIGSGGEEDTLKKELASTKTALKNSEAAQAEAEESAERIRNRKAQIIGRANQTANKIVGKAKRESSSLSAKLSEQRGELESVEGELSETESSLSGAEEEKALSTIPGDGTFKAEVDYLPGTYRAPGGKGCYWATLNSADPYDIASNENATGPTIASITTPYFQTSGCGEWERIGE